MDTLVLKHGSLSADAVHLCIDMQNVFASETPWQVPWLPRILPYVERIAIRHPARNIFTRFMPPMSHDNLFGSWQRFYRRWPNMLRGRIDPRLRLVSPRAFLYRSTQLA